MLMKEDCWHQDLALLFQIFFSWQESNWKRLMNHKENAVLIYGYKLDQVMVAIFYCLSDYKWIDPIQHKIFWITF